MRGIAGLSGWQWIFILEGLLTFVVGKLPPFLLDLYLQPGNSKLTNTVIVLALIAYKVMQDYPGTAKFLTQEERDEVQARLKRDRSSLADEFDMKYFWDAVKDWKIWVHMFITIGVYTGLYSYSLFLPTIINDLGTASTRELSQLMTVPPYVVACIFCVSAGWYADRLGQRGIFMIGFMVIAYVPSGLSKSLPQWDTS
jgi:MFS family permease